MKGTDLTLIDSAQSLQEKKSIILSSISIPSKLVGESDSSFRVLSDASQLINSLTEWCHTITNPYGVQVHNLTTNLADGRALCLIINHYHPLILPLNNICHTTVSLLHPPNSTERGSGHDIIALRQGKQLATSYPIQILSKDDVRRGLEGERRNFDLLRSSCLIIGGKSSTYIIQTGFTCILGDCFLRNIFFDNIQGNFSLEIDYVLWS